jgi:hypothetical protein
MGLEAIAVAAAGFLAPYFGKAAEGLADSVGRKAAEAIAKLGSLVSGRFRSSGDDYGELALKRAAEKPDDEERVRALAAVLSEQVREDPQFRRELEALVVEAGESEKAAAVVNKWTNTISNSSFGEIIQIGSVHGSAPIGGGSSGRTDK